ncbi:pyridoxal-phosphate-dependent aminotransferase family protein [Shouchella shacheensis]|uniref:pyridoxal-phosphate-dependent aminotransferase family protein n=1 Tax=Shouchella shacheensis TaxID=1649580 RepID=UPI00073FEB47|nr:alanine--glyoxylate aminotransferase family protein [Shouchella shacheensis]
MNTKELHPSTRTIMTPGPVEVDPRVLRAMSTPVIGQFDPEFLDIMNETMGLIRDLFQTENHWSYTIDGTSRAGIEAVLCSIIEPGDNVFIPIFGRFGHLLTEIAARCGADVHNASVEWGTVFDPEELKKKIQDVNPKIVALVHGETSTGRMQPLKEIGQFCRDNDILFVVDAVATVGGIPFKTDEWNIDAAITGTQKCVSAPSGMALITYNERIEHVLLERKSIEQGLSESGTNPRRIHSNYFDLSQIQDYWTPDRLNHHTEATSMLYAVRESLRFIKQEGIENRYERHRIHSEALNIGLEAMGISLYGNNENRLPCVTVINVPEGIEETAIRSTLLEQFGIEIAGSFGPLKGKVVRIGTMGFSCRKNNILQTLGALESTFTYLGVPVNQGEAVQAALHYYDQLPEPVSL